MAKAAIFLFIKNWYKGNTFARYTFKLLHLNGEESVKKILPCLYSGKSFNRYDNVNLPYKKLKDIFDGVAAYKNN